MGDHASALPLFRQALEIKRTTLGEDHPEYASVLSNLAMSYSGVVGDHAAALPSTARRWRFSAHAQGEDHPDSVPAS